MEGVKLRSGKVQVRSGPGLVQGVEALGAAQGSQGQTDLELKSLRAWV